MKAAARRVETTPAEAVVVMGVCLGWAIWAALRAVLAGFPDVGGFSDVGDFGLVLTQFACAPVALVPLVAVSVLGFGLVQGLWYARTERLRPPVFAHVVCDIVAFASVAHS